MNSHRHPFFKILAWTVALAIPTGIISNIAVEIFNVDRKSFDFAMTMWIVTLLVLSVSYFTAILIDEIVKIAKRDPYDND
jgi:hypothetical protein